jgi:hypothetical protein
VREVQAWPEEVAGEEEEVVEAARARGKVREEAG